MGITFNADEVFEMAQQVEKNGARFYRKAAEITSDQQTKEMLSGMAQMEDDHFYIFEKMRSQLAGSEEKTQMTFDPDNQATAYLQAMAESKGYEGKVSPNEELTGNETPKEIAEIALNAEKDSVVFYFGVKSLMADPKGREKVEGIIKEELSHITTLLNMLKSLQ